MCPHYTVRKTCISEPRVPNFVLKDLKDNFLLFFQVFREISVRFYIEYFKKIPFPINFLIVMEKKQIILLNLK